MKNHLVNLQYYEFSLFIKGLEAFFDFSLETL